MCTVTRARLRHIACERYLFQARQHGVAYARTTPPAGRKYRLRDLSDASGYPISTLRGLITDDELQALKDLDLDQERAQNIDTPTPDED